MRKTIALTLAAFLLASSLLSCASSSENTGDNGSADAKTETAAETEADTTTARTTSLPDDLDFDGSTFTSSYGMWQGYIYYFFADEQNGDVMNDAIYERKRKVEEQLDVTLADDQNAKLEGVVAKVKKTVLAGEDAYQMAMMHCILSVAEFASGGYLYNWDTLPYVDFEADWWNQAQMDVLRLGKNTYYGVNDFMIPCPYVIFFNKDMVVNFGMDDPYQLVYDGSWTLDKFLDMAGSVSADLNGDGTMTIDDRYGVTTNEISKYISFGPGADQFMTQKDADGRVELAMNTDKMVGLVDDFAALANTGTVYIPKSSEADTQLTLDTGRLLFYLDAITSAETMRDYTVDIGFLPYPKYDEAQESYKSLDWGGLCCIPSTIQNPEMVGAVEELLAFYSAETVIPTYYDVILTGKLARDEDTVKMMDILFDTICYEVGGNYFGFSAGFSDLFFTIGRLSLTGKADFASWYAKNESAAIKTIDSFYTALEEYEG